MHDRTRRGLTVGGAVVMAAVGAWLWQSAPGPVPEAEPSPVERAQPRLSTAPPPPTATLAPAVAHFEALSRYPQHTRRIDRDSFDLLHPDARHERRLPVAGRDQPWEALLTADRYALRGDEAVTVSLDLWHDGQPVAPATVDMVAVRPDTGEALPLQTRRVDDTVEATFVPDAPWPDHLGPLVVEVAFDADGLPERTGTVDLWFTGSEQIPAAFTGALEDRRVRGDLLVHVGIEVYAAGRYEVLANLYDDAGEPFGQARFRGELAAGSQEATLAWAGLLFHDAEVDGRFTVGQLRGRRLLTGSVPDHQDMVPWPAPWTTTAAYDLDGFTDQIESSARRERMRAMYADAQARGVELTEPAYVDDLP